MPNPIYNSMANQNNPFMQIMQEAQKLKNTSTKKCVLHK